MAKPELGMKRQCQNCGAKFFDLNRSPIVCPKCSTVFQAPAISRAASRPVANDDGDEADTAPVEIISLEDADAGDEKAAASAVDDVEIEDDDSAADETFLEEEEEDADDVAGLIDGDIEDDEEA